MEINLSKELKQKIDLSKKEAENVISSLGIGNQKAQVILALDISGSMSDLLEKGKVQSAIERILPLALNFDDDGSVDFFLFNDKAFVHPNKISLANIEDFIKREVLSKYGYGGTYYAPVINKIRKNLGKDIKKSYSKLEKPKDLYGLFNLFSFFEFLKKNPNKSLISDEKINPAKQPAYVIFLTDGDNSDHKQAEEVIREASHEEIFWQFVGIGSSSFGFLEKLDNLDGRYIDNANFFQINDLDKINDNELYSRLLNEFPSWLKLARDKNIIV